jgi:hypothetical protein
MTKLDDLVPASVPGRRHRRRVKAKTAKKLLAHARAKPRAVNYGSGGVGAALHLATELLQLVTGTRMNHVPYNCCRVRYPLDYSD